MADISGDLGDWRRLALGTSAWFDAPSHTAGAELLRGIAEAVGERPLDVDLRHQGIHLRLPDADGVLAQYISDVARKLGLRPDPAAIQSLHLTIDATVPSAVLPFWREAFGYDEVDGVLQDPLRRDPSIRFEQAGDPRPLRNRIHFDVNARQPFAPERLAAIEGAREVDSGDYHLVAADAEGNEACLPTGPVASLGSDPATEDWRDMGCAVATYPTPSFGTSVELAAAAAELADQAGKALLVDVRPGSVTLDSGKDQQETEEFGNDEGFLELAGRIQSVARGMGLTADPAPRQRFLQIAIDAVDILRVRPFWMAVLGYEHGPYRRLDQDIYDPRRMNPVLWFQQMDSSDGPRRAQRNRIHFDLYVASDHAQARLDAALATGGHVVNDVQAPARWTLADSEGNEIDIVVA